MSILRASEFLSDAMVPTCKLRGLAPSCKSVTTNVPALTKRRGQHMAPACQNTLSNSVCALDDVLKLLPLAETQPHSSVPALITCTGIRQSMSMTCQVTWLALAAPLDCSCCQQRAENRTRR